MDKAFDPKSWEEKIYDLWEKYETFKAQGDGENYTILMPPPNANASLHAGHAMYTIDDILIRYKRMKGYKALWIPGMDHAGFETQFVYEKHLAKEGRSRMDFDRETLYNNVFAFVKENSGLIYSQFKRLGFSADWNRSVFMLDNRVLDIVHNTFEKMEKENLVYRDDYIVNYCPNCGTSLAELEVNHEERTDSLYYIKYPIKDEEGFVTVATVRPETILGDTAVAINPKDERYKNIVGKTLLLPLTTREIPVVADPMVDMEFGTGAVKITPAHDPNDFVVGQKLSMKPIKVVNLRAKIVNPSDSLVPEVDGLHVKKARELMVTKLKEKNLIEKIDEKYLHNVTICYKCKKDLEPTIIPNWFIKVHDLKARVKEVVEKDEIHFHPKKYKRHMLTWLDNMHDWPISRQIAWGIRIPAWYNLDDNPNIEITFLHDGNIILGTAKELLEKYSFEEIEKGLQSLSAPKGSTYIISKEKLTGNYLQETDTFDTWFSSGQWPITTIKDDEYSKFLPTDVLATLSDILKFWVSRMILFTLYLKNTIPFKDVYLWSMVADSKGVKMSKSKGNVINPIDLVEKYGADALRFSLIYGTPAGGKVILSEDKVRGMRNFANKIWNIGRFIQMIKMDHPEIDSLYLTDEDEAHLLPEDKDIIEKFNNILSTVSASLEKYKFSNATDPLYQFIWEDLASKYLESIKGRKDPLALKTLATVYLKSLHLLHPFMPFVTEAIWSNFSEDNSLLITSPWPEEI